MKPGMSRPIVGKLRALCLAFPEALETSSWGHPNFRAGKRIFSAFEIIKGRPSIAFRLEATDINRLLRTRNFFATPYGQGRWASMWVDGPHARVLRREADLKVRLYVSILPTLCSSSVQQREPSFSFHVA